MSHGVFPYQRTQTIGAMFLVTLLVSSVFLALLTPSVSAATNPSVNCTPDENFIPDNATIPQISANAVMYFSCIFVNPNVAGAEEILLNITHSSQVLLLSYQENWTFVPGNQQNIQIRVANHGDARVMTHSFTLNFAWQENITNGSSGQLNVTEQVDVVYTHAAHDVLIGGVWPTSTVIAISGDGRFLGYEWNETTQSVSQSVLNSSVNKTPSYFFAGRGVVWSDNTISVDHVHGDTLNSQPLANISLPNNIVWKKGNCLVTSNGSGQCLHNYVNGSDNGHATYEYQWEYIHSNSSNFTQVMSLSNPYDTDKAWTWLGLTEEGNLEHNFSSSPSSVPWTVQGLPFQNHSLPFISLHGIVHSRVDVYTLNLPNADRFCATDIEGVTWCYDDEDSNIPWIKLTYHNGDASLQPPDFGSRFGLFPVRDGYCHVTTLVSGCTVASHTKYDHMINHDVMSFGPSGQASPYYINNGTSSDSYVWFITQTGDVGLMVVCGTNGNDCTNRGYSYNNGINTNSFIYMANASIPTNSLPDQDGDGIKNNLDRFPYDPTQWQDSDGDGYGDNWGDPQMNATRPQNDPGQWVADATEPDACPNIAGTSWRQGYFGCPDSDMDGWADLFDDLPFEPTQWLDSDGDTWGDNNSVGAVRIDAFINDSTQWSDSDGDGYGDNWPDAASNATRQGGPGQWVEGANSPDRFPLDSAVVNDSDLDGAPDDWLDPEQASSSQLILDDCPFSWGNSTIDRVFCPDNDGDGHSDSDANWDWEDGADNFSDNPTQWTDYDGDGYGDNWAEATWNSTRSLLGIGLHVSNATEVDWCPDEYGTSTMIRLGCSDRDGDGLADVDDDHPDDMLRRNDSDGDGFDDDWEDDCPETFGTSLYDRVGCIDRDDDGYSDPEMNWTTSEGADAFPNLISQHRDFDGDGYGDILAGFDGDTCPLEAGNSSRDSLGCPDSDGDGWSNSADAFPTDNRYYLDSDGDGFEDELADDCIGQNGTSDQGNRLGCPDSDGDGWADQIDFFPQESTQWSDSDGDGFGDNYQTSFAQERNPDWPGIELSVVNNSDACPIERGGHNSLDGCPVEDSTTTPTTPDRSEYEDLKLAIAEENFAAAISNPLMQKVGIGVIVLSFLTFLQTNMVARLLPDSFAWVQFMKRKKTIQEEEEIELANLMSLVRFGLDDIETLRDELAIFRSDISGKEVRSELPKGALNRIGSLVDRLLEMNQNALEAIADDEHFFGLNVGIKADSRKEMIEQDSLFNQSNIQQWDDVGDMTLDEVTSQDLVEQLSEEFVPQSAITKDDIGYEWTKFDGVDYYRIQGQGDEEWIEWDD